MARETRGSLNTTMSLVTGAPLHPAAPWPGGLVHLEDPRAGLEGALLGSREDWGWGLGCSVSTGLECYKLVDIGPFLFTTATCSLV